MPTTVRFAADGRAFVAEKRGIIKAYDSVNDSSPTQVLDIRHDVHDFWDRGLLSIALDPDFLDGSPFIYLYYVYDAPPGQSAPTWPAGQSAPAWSNSCPTPPGATDDGCVVRSKLDRYTVNLSHQRRRPRQPHEPHRRRGQRRVVPAVPEPCGRRAGLRPGRPAVRHRRRRRELRRHGLGPARRHARPGSPTPVNPCGDPLPGGASRSTAPRAACSASQDIRTTGDPIGPGRHDHPDQPGQRQRLERQPAGRAAPSANAERIVADGFRNPFRMTFRPGHSDLYVGDVGNGDLGGGRPGHAAGEPRRPRCPNFGWPCYEGAPRQAAVRRR